MPREEIDELYAVFSRYHRPQLLDGCACCTSEAESQFLISKPLRGLGGPDLEHYAFQALTTWGTLDDYKYFLPRILELTDEGSPPCEIEVTLGKFDYDVKFCDWAADEQGVIRRWLTAAWCEAVKCSDTERADQLLCRAAPIVPDVQSLLAEADEIAPDFRSQYAIEQSNQTKRRLLNGCWNRESAEYRQVVAWLYPVT